MTPTQITNAQTAIAAVYAAQGNPRRLQLIGFFSKLSYAVSMADAATAQALILSVEGQLGPAANDQLLASFN